MILSKNQSDDLKQKIFFLKTLKKVGPQPEFDSCALKKLLQVA